jgi:hypothetical protein
LPPLPQRPLELFETPEPATLAMGMLIWRGARHAITNLSGCERLECEWWTPSPIARDYLIADLEDGRRLWIFIAPDGDAFVHGVFD